ncbi:MAG: hypothetical protein JJU34_16375 [Lunatimonas sp.]|uniref:hypothetical protein n=1 Tax=Lunatimonas sp. TaxID=2060141 RepID=UPI00263A6178|nr:hypothetical protein [Lunatimonas sp.]MCC5938857.1 hypothetical protein [Lunatimonas sp.]
MANHAVESLLLKHYVRGLHGVADLDAESKYRENNAHIADQIKEKYFKGYSLKGRGLKSRSFESGLYDGEEIHLFLLKNDVNLDSYDKYNNLVDFGLNRFWKGSQTIALRQGTLDYFFASFKSIQARDNFFIKHYDNRFFRRYNEFVNRFGGK